jgi:hypothetical protein
MVAAQSTGMKQLSDLRFCKGGMVPVSQDLVKIHRLKESRSDALPRQSPLVTQHPCREFAGADGIA